MTSTSSDTVIMEVTILNGKLGCMNTPLLSLNGQGVSRTYQTPSLSELKNGMISYSENPFWGEIPQHPCPEIVKDEEVAKLNKRNIN